jgi:hypothetical protein
VKLWQCETASKARRAFKLGSLLRVGLELMIL